MATMPMVYDSSQHQPCLNLKLNVLSPFYLGNTFSPVHFILLNPNIRTCTRAPSRSSRASEKFLSYNGYF
uniref:C.album mitochondrial plasmid mp1 DNA n=1 Tax=Chenopodium album TaxID=3559 RepID=Q96373_CHEAL|nr:unnamed protein product [Chenopodium album]